ncbi:MAG: UDP-N-acetylmuramoyl-L-alanine--D-glutamate ligase [Victivallales bacterium]|nr:UDP-N-acetylmuramoyl-L-alanine--D-glutamate ligase [Victivallales bacterium]
MKEQEKKYLVVGTGRTGLSCIEYLIRNNKKAVIADTRKSPPNAEFIKKKFPNISCCFGQIEDNILDKADCVIISPGIPLSEKFVQKAERSGKEVIGDVELFIKEVKAPIAAVTGTNGKTTVTTLIGKMAEKAGFKAAVGGNIGIPVLDLLKEPVPDLYVLELSSFQLQSAYSMNFEAAVLLNITEDHIDYHGTEVEYRKSKLKILKNCKNAVINRNLNYIPRKINYYTFSLNAPEAENDYGIAVSNGIKYLSSYNNKIMPAADLQIAGKHNQENALAALAAGRILGFEQSKMVKVLKEFHGIKHRCQLIAEREGVKWYNDSKATNVGAAIAAVEGLGRKAGNIILIAGGMGKNADFKPLACPLKKYVKKTILFGRDAGLISKVIHCCTEIEIADDLNKAVQEAFYSAQNGDIILFAPACSSFDMFENFEHRGNEFERLVKYVY